MSSLIKHVRTTRQTDVKNSKYTTKASVENQTADTKNNQDIPTSEPFLTTWMNKKDP
jgi:hypothetical protein